MTAPRFSVDYLDLILAMLREDLPGVTVVTRIPDNIQNYLPLVSVQRVGGDSPAPEFYDEPWVNIQSWCEDDRVTGIDSFRAAENLADQVRGILWTAWRTQRVVPGLGWLVNIRESTAPLEVSDPDRPLVGRYSATYELRVRPDAS